MKTLNRQIVGLSLALVLAPAVVPPAEAAAGQPLKVTEANLAKLSYGCWGSATTPTPAYVLYWNACTGAYNGASFPGAQPIYVRKTADPSYHYSGAADFSAYLTQFCHAGGYCGQCVSFVKVMAESSTGTWQWSRGARVLDGNVQRGTIIATFGSDGKYRSGTDHVAVFWGYTSQGIFVIDQNWVLQWSYNNGVGVVGAHEITWGQSMTQQAGNYYVVTT